MVSETTHLVLESLGNGIPVIPEEAVGFYKHNCMVCFHDQKHTSGVKLQVKYKESNHTCVVIWSGKVTDELRRAYADLVRASEYAACAIALLLVRELTEFTGVEQAVRGTTVDYYLTFKNRQDEMLIFNRAARLEVSGILKESQSNTVKGRIKEKIDRLKPEGYLSTLIIVVEFSKPWSEVKEA